MSNESQREKFLNLPGDRILAYDESGNSFSKLIVIFFHGAFGVGDAKLPSPVFLKYDIHYIAPTLPGFGNSTIRADPRKTQYYISLAQDITALLEHTHPGISDAPAGEYKLYMSGGSYGTVAAQMIFNVPLDVFPASKHLVACLLLGPISPFRFQKDYAKDMTWDNYIAAGPPSRYIPWQLPQCLASFVFSKKLRSPESSEALIRSLIFDHLKEDEKMLIEKWRKKRGLEAGQFEKDMAANMRKSVGKTWEGFVECADIIHGDLGFTLEGLSGKPIILVTATEDKMAPPSWAKWLAQTYPNARLKEVAGGHIVSLWTIDSSWEELMSMKG